MTEPVDPGAAPPVPEPAAPAATDGDTSTTSEASAAARRRRRGSRGGRGQRARPSRRLAGPGRALPRPRPGTGVRRRPRRRRTTATSPSCPTAPSRARCSRPRWPRRCSCRRPRIGDTRPAPAKPPRPSDSRRRPPSGPPAGGGDGRRRSPPASRRPFRRGRPVAARWCATGTSVEADDDLLERRPGPRAQGPPGRALPHVRPRDPPAHPDRRAGGPQPHRALRQPAGRRHRPDPREHLPRPGAERAAGHGGGVRRHRHAEERRALPGRRAVRRRGHRRA